MVFGGGLSNYNDLKTLKNMSSKFKNIEGVIAGKSLIGVELPNEHRQMVQLQEILGSKDDGVHAVLLEDSKNKNTIEEKCDGVFMAIGHKPNTDLFADILDSDNAGYLITKEGSTATNIEGVYACGDVQDHVYRQAVTAAGSGCMSALDAERYLEALESNLYS